MNAELKYEGCLVQVINWWARLGRCEKPEFQGFYDISFTFAIGKSIPAVPPPLSLPNKIFSCSGGGGRGRGDMKGKGREEENGIVSPWWQTTRDSRRDSLVD